MDSARLSVLSLLILLLILPAHTHGEFPNAWAGCEQYPTPVPLSPKALPAAITRALSMAETAVGRVRQQQGTVGMAMGVVYNQTLLWSRGFGLRNASDPSSAIDADTIFRIGSISKVFAMLTMVHMRDAGKLDFDDEVAKFVPEFGIQSPFPPSARRITFRQLATHLAGLPREAPCSSSCDFNNSVAWQRIRDMTAILPPDTRPIYSNLGFAVLGNVLAEMAGMPYDSLIHDTVIAPLGQTNTGVNMSKAPRSNLALPYTDSGSPCGAACLAEFGWPSPCGSMYSSVRDLGQILSLMFRDDVAAGAQPNQIIDGASVRDTRLIRYLTHDSQAGFALTWELYRLGRYMVRTKRGDVLGYSSMILFVPELKLGIVVLANEVEHAAAACQSVASILVPAFDALFRAAPQDAGWPAPPLPLAAYTGTFVGKLPSDSRSQAGAGASQSIVMSLSADGTHLLCSYAATVLKFLPGSSSDTHLFVMEPPAGDMESCFFRLVSDEFQLLQFHVEGGQVREMTMDIEWGIVFVKH